MEKLPVSVLIHTFNEEENIADCLETVKWADEIIVVDMYSEDKTVEIAKKYTDKIYFFERMGYADPARQFALEKASNEWVLVVDADERVPLKLKKRLEQIMKEDIADIVFIPRNNYFFGEILKGNMWGPLQDIHPRLFKKGFIDLSPAVHEIFKIKKSARIYKITNPEEGFIHFAYIDVEHFLEKFNRYTTIEAKNMFEGLKKPPANFPKELYLTFRETIGRFFVKNGYKDGITGLYLAILMGAYRVSSFLKYRVMKKYRSMDPRKIIKDKYSQVSKQIIEEYRNDF